LSSQQKAKSNLADLLRVWVKDRMNEKYDYTLATNRKQDILNFIQANKSKLTNDQQRVNTIRSSMTPILDQEFKNRLLDPASMNRSAKGMKKGLHYNSDLNPTITPSPQAGANDTSPKPKPQDPNLQNPQQIIQPAYDEGSVSATFSALFLTFRMAIPDIELLTNEEKNALGKMWLPAFNLYMSNEKWAVIGIPIMGTLGIFLPKILEGRKKGKIRKSKLEGNLRQKEIDDKNESRQNEITQMKKQEQSPTRPNDILPKKE
jgi:hypothetical protein